jgi:hypothetical protein
MITTCWHSVAHRTVDIGSLFGYVTIMRCSEHPICIAGARCFCCFQLGMLTTRARRRHGITFSWRMFKSKVRSAAPSANKHATNNILLLLKALFYFTISVCATCSTTTCCFCTYVAEPIITHIITQHIAAFSSTSYILYSTAAFIWLWSCCY